MSTIYWPFGMPSTATTPARTYTPIDPLPMRFYTRVSEELLRRVWAVLDDRGSGALHGLYDSDLALLAELDVALAMEVALQGVVEEEVDWAAVTQHQRYASQPVTLQSYADAVSGTTTVWLGNTKR